MKIIMTTAAVALMATAGLTACSSEPDEPDEYGARDVCEQFVEKRLKAPATAEFENTATTESGNEWTVEGDVDAENSFGAQIRNHYVCTVAPTDSTGSNWRLVDLQMAE